MIMHIQDHNGSNGSKPSPENGNSPPPVSPLPRAPWDNNLFDPRLVESLANELYAAIPGRSSAANQVNQAEAIGEIPTPMQPTVPPTSSLPVQTSPRVTTPSLSAPEAGIRLPQASSLNSGAPPTRGDALTRIAQQLYAQISPNHLDAAMQQVIASLNPALSQGIPPLSTANIPDAPLSQDALSAMVHSMLQSIPTIDPPGIPAPAIGTVETPPSKSEEAPQTFYFLSAPTVEPLGLKSETPFDVEVIRRDFPILHQRVHGKPLIWLDNAATTQKPQSVIDAISHFYEHDNSNVHRGAHTLAARATDAYEAARETVQRFIGAGSATEIVFVRGTTEAINLVAQTYGQKHIQAGDEIILSTLEHHANIVPWQMLAQTTGAVLKVIPVTDSGEIILEEYARLLSPRTRIVAVTQVSNALGTILPVKEITEMAHRYRACVLIDGAQGLPHLSVNVQAIDCDFYVFSGHKLFAPTGIGVLYGKRKLLEEMPPWQGGGSMIRHVTFEHTIYADPPAKFEAGTPNIADAVGLGAAIDYLTRLGMNNLEHYERQLTEYAIEQLIRIPRLRLIGTALHKVGVLSFLLDGFSVEDVGKRLDQEGIAVRAGHHCAQPTMQRYGITGTVRPSLGFYNTYAEIDTLVDVLRTLRYR